MPTGSTNEFALLWNNIASLQSQMHTVMEMLGSLERSAVASTKTPTGRKSYELPSSSPRKKVQKKAPAAKKTQKKTPAAKKTQKKTPAVKKTISKAKATMVLATLRDGANSVAKKSTKKPAVKKTSKTTKTNKKIPPKSKREPTDRLSIKDFEVGGEVTVKGAGGEEWFGEITRVRAANALKPIEVKWFEKNGNEYNYWSCQMLDKIQIRTVLETHPRGHFPAPAGGRGVCETCKAKGTTCAATSAAI